MNAIHVARRAPDGAGCAIGPAFGLAECCYKRNIEAVYIFQKDYAQKRHMPVCAEHLEFLENGWSDLIKHHNMLKLDIPTWQQYALDTYGRLPDCKCIACEPEA